MTSSERVDDVVAEPPRARARPPSVSVRVNVGTNAALIAPSAKRSRTRFGIRNATRNASISLPAPKRTASTWSRTRPSSRLVSVASPISPADRAMRVEVGPAVPLAGWSSACACARSDPPSPRFTSARLPQRLLTVVYSPGKIKQGGQKKRAPVRGARGGWVESLVPSLVLDVMASEKFAERFSRPVWRARARLRCGHRPSDRPVAPWRPS